MNPSQSTQNFLSKCLGPAIEAGRWFWKNPPYPKPILAEPAYSKCPGTLHFQQCQLRLRPQDTAPFHSGSPLGAKLHTEGSGKVTWQRPIPQCLLAFIFAVSHFPDLMTVTIGSAPSQTVRHAKARTCSHQGHVLTQQVRQCQHSTL